MVVATHDGFNHGGRHYVHHKWEIIALQCYSRFHEEKTKTTITR